jgi:predicted ATPase/DNA-binding winged helix-turn-helix (wHTH) protein
MPAATEPQAAASGNTAIAFGSFRLLPARRLLVEGDKPVPLGSRAFDILTALVERAGQVVSNKELIARAWPRTVIDDASLRINIAAIRRSLGDSQVGNRFIANVPGRGYSFVAPTVREESEQSAESPIRTRGNTIPASLSRILGRDDTVVAITRRLSASRLVTIVGPGGVGKTTVAAAVANAGRQTYPDGVWFVALAPIASPDLVPTALGTALDIPLRSEDPIAGLTAWLREKQALIVFDNCEHVVDAVADMVEALIAAAPHVTILATSREPLRVKGEWRHRLAPLGLPSRTDNLTTAELMRFPAIQLFAERATATEDGFNVDDDVRAVIQICRQLDGIPLALELAAAHVGVLGVRELAARLSDRFVPMIRGRRTALPRHQTLRATLDWSYNLLSVHEQIIFRRLAVFQGGFTMAAAEAVIADEELAVGDIINGIANLIDKSLIAADIGGDTACYHLLETSHTYALNKLRESGELIWLSKTHAAYFHRSCRDSETEAANRSSSDRLAEAGSLLHNCRAALDWAFSPNGDSAIAVQLTAALTPLWLRLSLMSECRRYVERALDRITETANQDARAEMELRAALGASLTYTTGPVPETEAAWSDTLRLAEHLDDTEFQLRALRGLWSYHMNAGEYREALAYADAFCDLAERLANPLTSRAGARMAGLILHYLGEQGAARERIEGGADNLVAASRGPPTPRFMIDQDVATLALLARTLWLQGLPDQATRTARRALEQANSVDHIISRCHALAQAAIPVALWVGDIAQAKQFVTSLIDLAAENLLEGWIARGKCFGGVLEIMDGYAAAGSAHLEAALRQLRAAGSTAEYPAFQAALAYGRARDGQIEAGHVAIDQAIALSERTEERWCAAELLRNKGELLLMSRPPNIAAAESAFQQSLDIARRQGVLSFELRAATSLARLWRDDGRRYEAHRSLATVYDQFSEGFETADLVVAKQLLDGLAGAEHR